MLREEPKYYLNILNEFISRFFYNLTTFGLKIAFFNFLGEITTFYLIKDFKISKWLELKKNRCIYDFLIEKYADIIEEYKNKEVKVGENCKKIWCCWWQELDNAPELVKKCVNNIEKFSGDYELVIITKDNYAEYSNIPLEIIKKLDDGKITITHFTDILRANLLSLHGGVWVDSTMFICENVFNEFDNLPFNSCCRYCGFFMGGRPNKLFSFLNDVIIQYNLDYDQVITYLLIDYIIGISYWNFDECKQYIDDVTLIHPKLFYLEEIFSNPYVPGEFEGLCDEYKYFKLTYKLSHDSYDKDGNLTNFGFFLKNF